jgi:hypothetical protein
MTTQITTHKIRVDLFPVFTPPLCPGMHGYTKPSRPYFRIHATPFSIGTTVGE